MRKNIVSAVAVFACGFLMVAGSIAAYESQENENLTTAGVFNYTSTEYASSSGSSGDAGEVSVADSKDASSDVTVTDAPVVNTAARNTYGYTNLGMSNVEDTLNVRSEATTDSDIVGVMPGAAACEILDQQGDWYHIKSGEVEGYCLGSYIVTGDEALDKADQTVANKATVNCDALIMRDAPSTEAGVVETITQGNKVTVVEELDGWVKVVDQNSEGYCSAEYVTVGEEIPTALSKDQSSNGGSSLVSNALQYVGGRYVWGGESLKSGVDCSGFTMKIYEQYGVYLPHSADAQKNMGTKVASLAEAQPGDLVFYGSGGYANHVGIYMGDGQLVHASSAKTGIKVSNASYRTPIAIRRYL
ncbi:MAG: SH3 domain-containing protein [Lachnospiraceae bacterium]|nr:SH3 domain-containing protein [Lachnospiraceae bacterium]